MRDMMLLGMMVFLIPLALSSTFAAYLFWGWTAVISLESYTYGFMSGMRFNLIAAVIALGMLIIGKDKHVKNWSWNRTTVLLVLFLVQGTLSAVFAYQGTLENWMLYDKLVKVMLFVLVMPLVVKERYQFHALVVMTCLGLGFHGLVDGLKFLATGGGHIVRGIGKFGDNNHFAVLLMMSVPFMFYLYAQSVSRWVKLAAMAGMILTIAAVVGTHSRGGLLTLIAVAMWLIFTGKRKFIALVAIGVAIGVAALLAPSSWTERMGTIKEANQDGSFMGRVEAWQVSSAIALQNPILGGGFHAVQSQPVWDRFRGNPGLLGFVGVPDNPSPYFRAAHSIYFQVMGDLGMTGFLIFLAILINTLLNAWQTRKIIRESNVKHLDWAVGLANSISAATIGYLVGGGGVSLAYAEVIYLIVMLSELLKQYVKSSVNSSNINRG